MPKEDLTNVRFGNLVVIEPAPDYIAPSGKKLTQWKCKCDCGNEVIALSCNLKKDHTKSCGCLKRVVIHGKSHERVYRIWKNIKTRCCYACHHSYSNYGGRGVSMCDEWKTDAKSFIEWSYKNGYNDTLTIDRINPNGDYSPDNCRWVDMKTQGNNRRNNHTLEYNNVTRTVSEWANIYGLSPKTILKRLKRGWSVERSITSPSLRC